MRNVNSGDPNTNNQNVRGFVEEMAKICQPEKMFWCDGSEEEKRSLTQQAVAAGILQPLDQEKLPGCYHHRSNPNDVARVEQFTFICTPTREEAGPTNNWAEPKEMYQKMYGLLNGSMKGRTMYVIPYLMGLPGSDTAKIGIELTDSVYVVLSMGIMTRIGQVALTQLGESNDFNRGVHSMLDVNPERRFITHFPHDNTILSVGSAYGGNVLLGKKCLALRIGSFLAMQQKWMAEHMLILGVEAPNGKKTFIAAAFPSACGKTNLAMLVPPAEFKGWKVWTVGDDIAWMKPGADGRLYAVNPEAGYFGVVPGTNSKSNPNAVKTISRNTFYTNVGVLPNGDVWWEGKDGPVPAQCIDWKGNPWTPDSKEKAAHPNSRFTAPMSNNPALAPEANDPAGVPISAIVFGGRRASTMPLVFESFDWVHGVYLGATMGSEMTAAAVGGAGQLRRDPMAMLPFCGYNMGRYFQHWLNMGRFMAKPPRIFHVNWFRKDDSGNFLWPGFGENMRVLKWIIGRCEDSTEAERSPIGLMPKAADFDLQGLSSFGLDQFAKAQSVCKDEWLDEARSQKEFLDTLRPTLPQELEAQRDLLVSRLQA